MVCASTRSRKCFISPERTHSHSVRDSSGTWNIVAWMTERVSAYQTDHSPSFWSATASAPAPYREWIGWTSGETCRYSPFSVTPLANRLAPECSSCHETLKPKCRYEAIVQNLKQLVNGANVQNGWTKGAPNGWKKRKKHKRRLKV